MGAIIGAGSEGLSVGHQQTISLVREILKKKKIVVLDEVTSSFDVDSEVIFKDVFFREFRGSTIFIISHRLETVLLCEKVIVMEKGSIKEFDSPKKLLLNRTSAFYNLIKSSNL